jgi:RNA polymerase sigma-70 factor, ECF subfamily
VTRGTIHRWHALSAEIAGDRRVPRLVSARESMRLALIATLQHLPAQRRAILLLRDVLAFPAAEVAAMLGTTVAAVKSALQRAGATIKNAAPMPDEITEPSAPRAREVLEQYIAAFENADAALLERILRHDAALEMIGSRTWFAGRATCMPYIATHVLGAPGDWRMLPIIANGQPAAVAYHRGEPFGIAVLTVTRSGISRIVVFDDAGLVAKFRLDANVRLGGHLREGRGARTRDGPGSVGGVGFALPQPRSPSPQGHA